MQSRVKYFRVCLGISELCYQLATILLPAISGTRRGQLFSFEGGIMHLVRFYAAVIKIGIALALLGTLKSCTLQIMGLAAAKSENGIMSYSRYTRMLTQ